MTNDSDHPSDTGSGADGSSDATEADKEYTESLGDGSANEDADDTDYASGGEPQGS